MTTKDEKKFDPGQWTHGEITECLWEADKDGTMLLCVAGGPETINLHTPTTWNESLFPEMRISKTRLQRYRNYSWHTVCEVPPDKRPRKLLGPTRLDMIGWHQQAFESCTTTLEKLRNRQNQFAAALYKLKEAGLDDPKLLQLLETQIAGIGGEIGWTEDAIKDHETELNKLLGTAAQE